MRPRASQERPKAAQEQESAEEHQDPAKSGPEGLEIDSQNDQRRQET